MGSFLDIDRIKLQFKDRNHRLHKQLKFSKGGRGKKDKYKYIEQFREKQRNFIRTYNHFLSKNIIEFVLKHKYEYIFFKQLDKSKNNKQILSNWSYYDLQEKIIYKAERKGLKVRNLYLYSVDNKPELDDDLYIYMLQYDLFIELVIPYLVLMQISIFNIYKSKY